MTLQLSYFAWVRERLGRDGEMVDLPATVATIGALIAWLAARDDAGAHCFSDASRIRAAIDGEMVGHEAALTQAREVALFPPVTGG